MKKYIRCFVISLLMALLISMLGMDLYQPIDATESPNELLVYDGDTHVLHQTEKVGIIGTLQFYFSSKATFLYFIKMIFTWFVPIFLASALSTFLNTRTPKA